MDIRLIRTDKKLIRSVCCGDIIIELSAKRSLFNLTVYDPVKNTVYDIHTGIPSERWIPVSNCIYGSGDYYYAVSDNAPGSGITVYRFSSSDRQVNELFSFSKDLFPGTDGSFRIFIVNDDQIIVQSENYKVQDTKNLMGNIEFFQILFNISSGEQDEVKDQNLINNGINMIVPVSGTEMMMKTGFSSLEDSRIDRSSESDALIESVYFGGIAMFISSAFKNRTTINYDLIQTTYFDKGIIEPKVSDDYIFFNVFDFSSMSSESVFYNYLTDETLRCLNEDVQEDDILRACVIGNRPYVRSSYPDRTVFFNVLTSESDSIFYDETFVASQGPLLIFEANVKGRPHIRIYKSPVNDLVLEEKGRFLTGCACGSTYYIYYSAE